MSLGFTFNDFNTKLADTFFSIDANGDVQLNVSKICNFVFTDLAEFGILKFTYFFLKKAFQVQTEMNKTATVELDEFNIPIFSSVDTSSSPPTQSISVVFDAKLPLDEHSIVGIN